MREDLIKALLPTHGESIDPVAMARKDMKKALPKRFYKTAAAEKRDGAFVLVLDGKSAHTPGRNAIALPSQEAGDAVAAEWAAQGEFIEPGLMPLTRMVNSALDGVVWEMDAVRAEIVKYAGTDLLCYRASEPESLVGAQSVAWDPVLALMREHLRADFAISRSMTYVAQPESALEAVRKVVAAVRAPIPLAALNVMTTIMGSCILGLAVAQRWISAEQGWAAAHVDEDFQIRNWGEDDEAQARRQRRWVDMSAAARLYELTTQV